MIRFDYHTPLLSIKTEEDVIKQLQKLEPKLSTSDLKPLIYFNQAYLVVTKQINQARVDDLFEDPMLMDKLEVAFALKYFEALNQYAERSSLPKAWGKASKNKQPPWLSLLFGANAHINYDLPLALKDVIHQPHAFQGDYFKVSKLLKQSGRQISKSYDPSRSIHFFNKILRAFYLRPVMWLILRWRAKAWQMLVISTESSQTK